MPENSHILEILEIVLAQIEKENGFLCKLVGKTTEQIIRQRCSGSSSTVNPMDLSFAEYWISSKIREALEGYFCVETWLMEQPEYAGLESPLRQERIEVAQKLRTLWVRQLILFIQSGCPVPTFRKILTEIYPVREYWMKTSCFIVRKPKPSVPHISISSETTED